MTKTLLLSRVTRLVLPVLYALACIVIEYLHCFAVAYASSCHVSAGVDTHQAAD